MNFVKFNGGSFRPDPKPPSKDKTKKKRIAPVGAKRIEDNKIYSVRSVLFIEGKICPITNQPATQVHHMKGRRGILFLDERFWLAVSAEGHDKIERNPKWAYKNGYSLLRNAK